MRQNQTNKHHFEKHKDTKKIQIHCKSIGIYLVTYRLLEDKLFFFLSFDKF